jgi:ATP-dependent Zn protease
VAALGLHREEHRSLNRLPWLVVVCASLVVLLGWVFRFTWQQVGSGSGDDEWAYSRLVGGAQAAQVRSVEIDGSSATVIARDRSRHHVRLPDETAALASELTRDGVTVRYVQRDDVQFPLSVLLPNVILFLLIGGFLYYLFMRARAGRPPT